MDCQACGKTIEVDSRFCRLCGVEQRLEPALVDTPASETAEEPNASLTVGWIAGGICLVILIGLIALAQADRTPSQPASSVVAENIVSDADLTAPNAVDEALLDTEAEPPTPAPAEPWTYSTSEDKVRGTTSYFATSTSTNSVELDAPYDGGSTLRMTVRKSAAQGTDVILVLSSGQLLCHAYDGCYATVRFDEAPAERVELVESSDNSSDTVFVSDAEPFVAKLKKAKRAIVEIEIYEAGRPQFEFDIRGLKWAH